MKKNFLTFITLLMLIGGFTETKYALAEKTELKSGLIFLLNHKKIQLKSWRSTLRFFNIGRHIFLL